MEAQVSDITVAVLKIDVVAEDQIVALATVEHIVTSAADDDIVDLGAEYSIVTAGLQFLRINFKHCVEQRRLNFLRDAF